MFLATPEERLSLLPGVKAEAEAITIDIKDFLWNLAVVLCNIYRIFYNEVSFFNLIKNLFHVLTYLLYVLTCLFHVLTINMLIVCANIVLLYVLTLYYCMC